MLAHWFERADEQGFLRVQLWHGENTCECVASKIGIQSDNVLTQLLDAFWPLCRTPTLHTGHIQHTHNGELLGIASLECSKLQILTVVNIKPIKSALHNPTQVNSEAYLSEVYFL